MKVYISSKITGTTDYMERFNKVERALQERGHDVINPAKLNKVFPEGTSWETYMRNCIKLLADADAICMFGEWRDSKGAMLEHLIALRLGMTILYHA